MAKFFKTNQMFCLLTTCLYVTTLEATWSDSQTISSTNTDFTMAMDGVGNTMVVWTNSPDTAANRIHYNYLNKNDNWHRVNPLSSGERKWIFSTPQLAISADSQVVVVWEEYDEIGDKTSTVKTAWRRAGETWAFADLIKKEGAGRQPIIAINSSGYAVATWLERNESILTIQSAALQVGKEWSAPLEVGKGAYVQIKVDDAGNAVAVWLEGETIKSANLPFQGTWTAPTVIGNSPTGMFTFGMNEAGYGVVVWTTENSIVNATMESGVWTSPQELSINSKDFIIQHLEVVVGVSGQAFAAWEGDLLDRSLAFPVAKGHFIRSADIAYKGHWTNAQLHTPKNEFSNNLQIAIDTSENVYMTWMQDGKIYAKKRQADKWTNPEVFSPDNITTTPKIAVDPTGYTVVCWGNKWGAIEAAIWQD